MTFERLSCRSYFVTKNKIWEIPIFLAVTLILFRPDLIASWIGLAHEQRYWTYAIGLAIFGLLFLMQRPRAAKAALASA